VIAASRWLAGALLAAAAPLPVFVDATAKSGVRFKNEASLTARKYLIESMVGGVAMFDYDGDGRQDLYFVNGAALHDPMPPGTAPDKSGLRYWNRLYRNNGEGTFIDVTEAAGVRGHSFGMGVAAGDYDNDGDADLYVTNYGGNILYRNNGDGSFTDVTGKAGVAGGGWSAGAAFFDYDADAHLDLVVSRYVEWDFALDIWCGQRKPGHRAYCHPDQFQPAAHLLYHNNGDGTFSDVSKASGFTASPGKGLGVAIEDFDQDGHVDVLIANDSFPQQLFRNLGGGKFQEVALERGAAYDIDGKTFAGMGADFSDYDNDGWPDIFINALANQRYAIYHNAKGNFDYVSTETGVGALSMVHSGWGTKFVDYDNDGWKDLFVAQGHVMDNIELTQPHVKYLEPLLLARNVKGRFENVSDRSGDPFHVRLAARGVAFGDIDNDGFQDVVINCNNRPALVLRNNGGNGNHWLLLEAIGSKSNRDGIGAKVRVVTASGLSLYAMVSPAGSYLSSNDKRVHFGLGQDPFARLVEITWPSGRVQKLENVKADQALKVKETP